VPVNVLEDISIHVPRARPGDRGADRQRQDHAGGADYPAVGSSERQFVARWRSIRDWPLEQFGGRSASCRRIHFFTETLAAMLLSGGRNFHRARVGSSQIASIDAEFQDFPAKYETLVASVASRSPAGRRAHHPGGAILRDPKILILDDALSSVDTDTEERILLVREVMRGRTTILTPTAARPCATPTNCGAPRGRIVERGTHDELLAQAAIICDLYNNNCLRKNSNAHERFPRRRGAGQSIRRETDAPLDALYAPVQ